MLSGDDFAAVLKSRERKRSAHFSLHWRSRAASGDATAAATAGAIAIALAGATASRLGLVVSKKLARTSVRRNLIKRQSRMLFAAWLGQRPAAEPLGQPRIDPAWDVVLKLTANVSALPRAAQFAEIAGLMHALPAARVA